MTAWSSLVGVVILAGGASRRMGTDKLSLKRDGLSLLDTVITGVQGELDAHSCQAGVVVVGPRPADDTPHGSGVGVTFTREEPHGAGPIAALAAGLALLDPGTDEDSLVVVLAGDAPLGPTAIESLIEPLVACARDQDGAERPDAAVLIDVDGRRQTLCAAYRLLSLRHILRSMGDLTGRSMKEAVSALTIIEIPDPMGAAFDIDTPRDAERWGFTDI